MTLISQFANIRGGLGRTHRHRLRRRFAAVIRDCPEEFRFQS